MELIYWGFLESVIGGIVALESGKGVMYLGFGGPGSVEHYFLSGKFGKGGPLKSNVLVQVDEYLKGQRTEFDVLLDLRGTPFMLKVWQQLIKIPYGKTATYADVAANIGMPTATRAVGQANSRNPVSIIVPCHRVVAQDGLGGYAGGLWRKKLLLGIEGIKKYRD